MQVPPMLCASATMSATTRRARSISAASHGSRMSIRWKLPSPAWLTSGASSRASWVDMESGSSGMREAEWVHAHLTPNILACVGCTVCQHLWLLLHGLATMDMAIPACHTACSNACCRGFHRQLHVQQEIKHTATAAVRILHDDGLQSEVKASGIHTGCSTTASLAPHIGAATPGCTRKGG